MPADSVSSESLVFGGGVQMVPSRCLNVTKAEAHAPLPIARAPPPHQGGEEANQTGEKELDK